MVCSPLAQVCNLHHDDLIVHGTPPAGKSTIEDYNSHESSLLSRHLLLQGDRSIENINLWHVVADKSPTNHPVDDVE